MHQYLEAEHALSEANILNNLDPVVWAYLALLCRHTNQPTQAKQAIKFALKVCKQQDWHDHNMMNVFIHLVLR